MTTIHVALDEPTQLQRAFGLRSDQMFCSGHCFLGYHSL